MNRPSFRPVGSRTPWRAAAVGIVLLALLAAPVAIRPSLPAGEDTPAASVESSRAADWVPSYARDVQPLLDRACVTCHGSQRADKGLRLDSYQRTMAGDSYGTVVIPGGSSLSAMISVVKFGAMPHRSARLSPEEIETISRWIDAGAPDN